MANELKQYCIEFHELQEYLDKYGKKIKFILPIQKSSEWPNGYCLVIDETP